MRHSSPAVPLLLSLALASSALLASSAKALTVQVSAGGASGESLWSFSGFSIYSQLNPGGKIAGGALALIEEWKGDGSSDYVKTGAYNNYEAAIISGSIQLTVTPQFGSPLVGQIDGLHIDHDNSGDDFGVSLLGSDIPLSDGDVVSWSGSGIFPVNLANLNTGKFYFNNYSEVLTGPNTGQPYGHLSLDMEVAPSPGPLPIAGCGVAFTFVRRLRRACKDRDLTIRS